MGSYYGWLPVLVVGGELVWIRDHWWLSSEILTSLMAQLIRTGFSSIHPITAIVIGLLIMVLAFLNVLDVWLAFIS